MKYFQMFIIIVLMLNFISCKNNHERNIIDDVNIETKEEKGTWYSRLSSLGYKSDNSLKIGDINNLDKIYGFRLAKFNSDIFDYKINNKQHTYLNGPGSIQENLDQNKYNYIYIFMSNDIADKLNKGVISHANLTFLDRKLKKISFEYNEAIYNNGVEEINLSRDPNQPADYSQITLFEFYKNALGEPTKIYTSKLKTGFSNKNIRDYDLVEDKNMDEVLKILDEVVEMDVKFIWETDKVYFEIYFDSCFDDGFFTKVNKEVEGNFKVFKLYIETYVKEFDIQQKLQNGSEEYLEFINRKLQNESSKQKEETLNTL